MQTAETYGLPTARVAYGAVRIFSRDNGRLIRIEAGGERLPGPDEKLSGIWWFASEQVAHKVADECITLLISARYGMTEGWLPFPADKIRTIVETAKTHVNVSDVVRLPDLPAPRSTWTHRRVAWLGKLIGEGYDAKRIANDPLIRSTPNNVYRIARRMGLSFAEAPTGSTTLRLPVAAGAFYDQAAARCGLTRDALMRRILIRLASDPVAADLLLTAE